MELDDEVQMVRDIYTGLAQHLWNGTDPLAPAPMEDRDIFELLGFD
jgi:light-independent protochlorophyllide reductase subunit L